MTCRAMKKHVGLLNVKVIKAIKLKKKDLLDGSDPYVKLTLSGDKVPGKKTVVKHSNLNPEWNEEFDLVVKEPESQELQLIVYDWEQVTPTTTNRSFFCYLDSHFFDNLSFAILLSS